MKEIKTGENHLIALSHDGFIYTFGNGYYGQRGDGISNTKDTSRCATLVRNITNKFIVKIFTGANSTIIETSKKELYGFGCNCYGNLGLDSRNGYINKPKKLPFSYPDFEIINIEFCRDTTILLDSQGRIWVAGLYENNYIFRTFALIEDKNISKIKWTIKCYGTILFLMKQIKYGNIIY